MLTDKSFPSDFRVGLIAFLFSNFSAYSAESVVEYIPRSPFTEYKVMTDE